jgi:hypothetical protein
MTRTIHASICALLLVAPACGSDDRQLVTPGVDCTAANAYELLNIFDFEGSDSGWYLFTDHTPGGVPDPTITSNVAVAVLDPPRCDSHQALEFLAYGNNYWGAGFGDWAHNSAPADGTGYEGISFWARSPGNTDKTFLLSVDDNQTFKASGVAPGDIASGTNCRMPPPQSIGDPSCYYGGTQTPDAVTRVPEPDECGNSFHTWVTTTEDWQLFLIPWDELVQWPCPNRVAGGINPAQILQFQIRLVQGSHYDIWLDDMNFYRLRAGS